MDDGYIRRRISHVKNIFRSSIKVIFISYDFGVSNNQTDVRIDHMATNRIYLYYRWSSLQGFPLIQIKYALLSISNFNLNGHNVAVRFVTLILQIRNPPIFTNRQLSVGPNIMISTCTVIVITPFGIETGLVKLYQNRIDMEKYFWSGLPFILYSNGPLFYFVPDFHIPCIENQSDS